MEMRITSDKENKLFNRREISITVEYDKGTPKKEDLARELCKKFNLSPDSTIIVNMEQGFGRKESTALAYSYKSKELLERYEPKHLLARLAKKKGKEEKQVQQNTQEQAAEAAK